MPFFDEPPTPPAPPPAPPPRPEWMGAPEGWLGGFVPARVVLARSSEVVVTLGPMQAYPTGVSLLLTQTTRVPRHGPGAPMLLGPGGPRFGIAFADGRKWQSGGQPPFPHDVTTPPPGPVLVPNGGGGGGHDFRMSLWLWPLPPPGPVTFGMEWEAMGLAETTTALDGDLFRAAAEEAEQLWEPLTPDERQAGIEAQFANRPGGAFSVETFRSGKTAGPPD